MSRRLATPLVAAALLALAAAGPAAAKQQLIQLDLPSRGNVDPAQIRFNGADHPKQLVANVLLPDGYDARPNDRWPLMAASGGDQSIC